MMLQSAFQPQSQLPQGSVKSLQLDLFLPGQPASTAVTAFSSNKPQGDDDACNHGFAPRPARLTHARSDNGSRIAASLSASRPSPSGIGRKQSSILPLKIWENDMFEVDQSHGCSPASSARTSSNATYVGSSSPGTQDPPPAATLVRYGSSGAPAPAAHYASSPQLHGPPAAVTAAAPPAPWMALEAVSESDDDENGDGLRVICVRPGQKSGHQSQQLLLRKSQSDVAGRSSRTVFVEGSGNTNGVPQHGARSPRPPGAPVKEETLEDLYRQQQQEQQVPRGLNAPEAFEEEVRKLLLAGNRDKVVHLPAPKVGLARCFIRRDMGLFGIGRSYELFTEDRKMFLLSAREHQHGEERMHKCLRISQQVDSRGDPGAAQVDISKTGFEFVLWGQSKPAGFHADFSSRTRATKAGAIRKPPPSFNEAHTREGPRVKIQVLGGARPYGMNVTLPNPESARHLEISNHSDRLYHRSAAAEGGDAAGRGGAAKGGGEAMDLTVLVKRGARNLNSGGVPMPHDFENRSPVKSNKNFQLVSWTEVNSTDAKIMLQLCKVADSTYALDFAYPFTAETAFAVALAAMLNRIGQNTP